MGDDGAGVEVETRVASGSKGLRETSFFREGVSWMRERERTLGAGLLASTARSTPTSMSSWNSSSPGGVKGVASLTEDAAAMMEGGSAGAGAGATGAAEAAVGEGSDWRALVGAATPPPLRAANGAIDVRDNFRPKLRKGSSVSGGSSASRGRKCCRSVSDMVPEPGGGATAEMVGLRFRGAPCALGCRPSGIALLTLVLEAAGADEDASSLSSDVTGGGGGGGGGVVGVVSGAARRRGRAVAISARAIPLASQHVGSVRAASSHSSSKGGGDADAGSAHPPPPGACLRPRMAGAVVVKPSKGANYPIAPTPHLFL